MNNLQYLFRFSMPGLMPVGHHAPFRMRTHVQNYHQQNTDNRI